MKHTSANPEDQRTTQCAPRFLAIVGPTASGKSELALRLAERFHADILCVDAMQTYTGLDFGTAKPTQEERARIRHHGLDLAQPWEPFNASRYAEQMEPVLIDAIERDVSLLLCGGTGLYYRALLEGFFEAPEPDADLRRRLHQEAAEKGSASLYERLRRLDPPAAAGIHPNDARRIVRAMEIIEQTGESVSALRSRQIRKPWLSMTRFIGIRREPADLVHRIEERTNWMYRNGLIQETRWLMSLGCRPDWTAMQALGYKECWRALRGEFSLQQAERETIQGTIRYAKRQMTWFRRQFSTAWLDAAPNQGIVEIEKQCLNIWSNQGYNDA